MELNREQIIYCLEQDIKMGCGMYREIDVTDLKRALLLIKELAEENKHLEYTLLGVMHFVDKWLDGAELEMDEVNRAITMREKTLQIVESLTEKWGEAANQVNYITDVTKADTVHKMRSMIKEECIAGGIYPAFVARVVENVGKKLLEGTSDV